MLQTRNGKRTGSRRVKFAVDMVKEKLIDWKTAVDAQSRPTSSNQLLQPIFDAGRGEAKAKADRQGLHAGPGAASRQDLSQRRPRGDGGREGRSRSLLVRIETSPKTCAA